MQHFDAAFSIVFPSVSKQDERRCPLSSRNHVLRVAPPKSCVAFSVSPVACHTSLVTSQTIHVTRHTSHVTRHISHVKIHPGCAGMQTCAVTCGKGARTSMPSMKQHHRQQQQQQQQVHRWAAGACEGGGGGRVESDSKSTEGFDCTLHVTHRTSRVTRVQIAGDCRSPPRERRKYNRIPVILPA